MLNFCFDTVVCKAVQLLHWPWSQADQSVTTAENHGENNLYVMKRGDLKVSTIVFENYFVLSISVGWMDDGLETTPINILGI